MHNKTTNVLKKNRANFDLNPTDQPCMPSNNYKQPTKIMHNKTMNAY